MSISAFIPVFNEEKRILNALTSLQWCDEIVILDKYSTDNTVEIARQFKGNVKIYFMENSDAYNASEFDFLLKYCTSEWIIMFTASDVLDRQLALQITEKISDANFNYDVIYVPYKRYVLGLETSRSPWYTESHPAVFKKSALSIDKNETHAAFKFSGKNYHLKANGGYLYHLTHETVDGMTQRHMRYWRAEGLNYSEKSMKPAFKSVLSSIYIILIKRRTFLMGWNGIALACAHLSYYMMSFVYKWERKNGSAATRYEDIRNRINADWH